MDLELVFAVIFYAVLGIFLYFKREKLKIRSKIIITFPSKKGIKFMKKLGKHKTFFKILSTIAIPVAIYFMVIVVMQIFYGVFYIFTTPEAAATVAFVVPGIKIPGSPLFFPFWYTIISLVIIATIHEFAHGIVAVSEDIPVKSAGFGLFLIFFLAFVEPDEKKMKKKSKLSRIRVASAGPAANIATAMIISLLFFAVDPVLAESFEYNGVLISGVDPGYPANLSGITPETVITSIDNVPTSNVTSFSTALLSKKPNQTISVGTDKGEFSMNLSSSPYNSSMPYMGVTIEQSWDYGNNGAGPKILYAIFGLPNYRSGSYEKGLLGWVAMLSFFVGMMNLLPVFFVDGGIIFHNLLGYVVKDRKVLAAIVSSVFYLVLVALVFNILGPLIV